jgi:putative oxidoreductase
MTSIARLIVRLTVGGLLAGHGAQKLFGSFGGYGVEGTAGWLESMNLKPGRQWAILAGVSEFGGGMLTALGALNPIGPIMSMGAMLMATVKVHAGKPIWVTAGGAELPVTNMAVQSALILAGPGKLSFDGLLGIRIPRWFGFAALAGMIATVALAVTNSQQGTPEEATETEQEAGHELQGGQDERMATGASADNGTGGTARPGVESWGSPDANEPEPEPLMSNPSPS